MNFYNDNDPENVAWLRFLIAAKHIPAGDVDGRSITEIQPDELTKYTQCHFFAGIGGWSLALRLAGVPDDYPLWTASCPCQPFSQTGKRLGFEDERHLWPVLLRLIKAVRPKVGRPAKLLGEQVASKDAQLWLDGVFADLEALDFAVGAFDLPAASVGAPNIRQRFWWVADSDQSACYQGCPIDSRRDQGSDAESRAGSGSGQSRGLANPDSGECCGLADGEGGQRDGTPAGREQGDGIAKSGGINSRMGNTHRERSHAGGQTGAADGHGRSTEPDGNSGRLGDTDHQGPQGRSQQRDSGDQRLTGAPSLGRWSAFELVPCGDGKVRRVEPGSFPLAHGIPNRVGPLLTALRPMGRSAIKTARLNRVLRLHAYGNAINPFVGAEFIISCRESGILI